MRLSLYHPEDESMHSLLPKSVQFPHVGQRMIKTALAVFLCLLVYRLLGYQGSSMPAEAAITAIICMQPFISDSQTFALNRFTGTIVGTVWGMVFLLLMTFFPQLGKNFFLLYALMGVGVLLSVYTAVLMHVPDISGLSAIVFICIVVQFPEIEEPFLEAGRRFLGVMIGTGVAIFVNTARLPRVKNQNAVFFVRGKDLTPSRFSRVPASILFQLNRLYEDGAKICIMLEHAPALFTMQMSSCHLNMPLIVMDGAAIYDTNENRYLAVQHIPHQHSAWLQAWLRDRQVNFFTYVIEQNRTCIYHDGPLNELELQVLKQLQRSPYRSYLEGENERSDDIVFLKVLGPLHELQALRSDLLEHMTEHHLRMVIREQPGTSGVSGLYIFSEEAAPHLAQKRYMDIMRLKYPDLTAVNIFSRNETYSEHDASVLLHRLTNAYEPISFLKK